MGKKWVRAKTTLSRHDMAGAFRTYQPGDWFQCNNQEMRALLERGMVDSYTDIIGAEYNFDDAGVLAISKKAHAMPDLDRYNIHIQHAEKMELPWEYTVLWKPPSNLNAIGAALGLTRLMATDDDIGWELAVALRDTQRTAEHVGSTADRQKTLELLGELYLPIYETGVVWVKRTPATEEVIQRWQAEIDDGASDLHGFLRALYTNPVLVCTLPHDWIGQWTWV